MDSLPPLSLEQFAAITARIDAGAPVDAALLEAEVSWETWARAQEAWLGLIASQVAQRRYSLQKRYTELVATYKKAALPKSQGDRKEPKHVDLATTAALPVGEEPKPAATTTALPVVEEPPPTLATAALPVVEEPPRPPKVAPPPLVPLIQGAPALSDREMAAIMSVPEDLSGDDTLPIPSKAPVAREPLPFRPAHLASSPAGPPSGRSPKTQSAGLGDTLSQDTAAAMRAAMKSALPFQPVGASAAARAPASIAPDKFGERIDLGASVQQFRELLKQREQVAGAQPTSAAPVVPAVPAAPPRRRVNRDQKRTIAMSAVPDPGAPLSNGPTTAPMPVVAGPVPLKEQKKTIAMSAVPDAAPARPVAAPSFLPQLTLAQYARVCVDLWREPTRAGAICARYGIADMRTWTAVNQVWQDRLSKDPTLMARWTQLTERMRAGH